MTSDRSADPDTRGSERRSARAPGRALRAAAVLSLAAGFAAAGTATAATAQAAPSKPAIVNGNTWYLRNSLTSGPATTTFRYGSGGDIPVMGDWDGNGTKTPGMVRATPSGGRTVYTWYLRNSNTSGVADLPPFVYGDVTFVAVDQLGTLPVVGDWNGDGIDTVGVMMYGQEAANAVRWFLRDSNSAGPATYAMTFGTGRGYPVTGDWDGDGKDGIGLRPPGVWALHNTLVTSGKVGADLQFRYGSSTVPELPVVGDWDGNGTDTPAVLRNDTPAVAGGYPNWLYRNSNTTGPANGQFRFGSSSGAFVLEPPIETIPRLSWK